ncbi:MAG TPA: alpha/beta hydrolase [Kiloniellales bacterium]|nr:alpha/beta hydrolase [Kiloniellales bacterium]
MTTLAENPLQAIIEYVQSFYDVRRDATVDPVTRLMEARRLFLVGGCVEGRVPRIATTTRVIPVRQGGVRGEWVLAAGARPERRLLYIHGGGMCMGEASSYRHMVEPLSEALQAAVFSLDYRLAPEDRFPAAPDDCLAAWRWMERNGPADAAPAEKLWVAGDSAGGNLLLVLLGDLKRQGGRTADAAVAIAPLTDFTHEVRRREGASRRDPYLTVEGLATLNAVYLPAAQDPRDPRVSPLFGDLAGLPPTLLDVGEREVLLDDAKAYAERATAAGSPVRLAVRPGMPHVFQWWCHLLPEARANLAEIAAFLREPKT